MFSLFKSKKALSAAEPTLPVLSAKLQKLISRLQANDPALTEIDLNGGKIGVAGVEALSKTLERNTALTKIYLYDNEIGDAGAEALSSVLEQNTTLTTIDLGSNNIGNAGVESLSRALERNTTLIKINLAFNKIDTAGVAALSRVLERNTTLINISLWGNHISKAGAEALSRALERNTTLTEIDLGYNDIGDAGMATLKHIKAILARNKAMSKAAVVPVSASGGETEGIRRLEAELEGERRQIEALKVQPPVATPMAAAGALSLIPYRDLEIGRMLGCGGFGTVHEATWRSLPVAVKLLPHHYDPLPASSVAEFNKEALLHASLHHENIVALKGVCLEPGKYALVMELLSHGSLYGLLHNGQALPWSMRLSIAKDIANGLAYLHEQGIIHQNLKSLTILLDDRLHAKLDDFALSDMKAKDMAELWHPKYGAAWIAPELFPPEARPTVLSDIYALGVVLWELASRELPFKDVKDDDLIAAWVTHGKRENIPAGTPPQIASLITRCWDGDPSKRPGSAQTLLRELMTEGRGGGSASSAGVPKDSVGYLAYSDSVK